MGALYDAKDLRRAIEHLRAVELPDGDYAYWADETRSWWVVDAYDLGALGAMPDLAAGYSRWCADTTAIPREQWERERAQEGER